MLFALTVALIHAGPCGTPVFARDLPPPRRNVPTAVLVPGMPLQERDDYALPNSESNDRFVVRWGNGRGDLTQDALALLDDVTRAYDVQVTEQGLAQPPGMDTNKFNIYIGSTGDGAPDDLDYSGYFWVDISGEPMLVVSPDTLIDPEDRAWTATHEFFHAVQYSYDDAYTYDGEAGWFFEASAEWAAGEVDPENAYHGAYFGAYLMLPHLGVPFFDYFDTGALPEYHQYGASLFLRFVSEHLGLAGAMNQAWLEPDGNNEPMFVLVRAMVAAGIDFPQAMAEFGASTVTMDYQFGDLYQANRDIFVPSFPNDDFAIAGALLESDTPQPAPEATQPERFGFNLLQTVVSETGRYRVAVTGDGISTAVVVQGADAERVEPFTGSHDIDVESGDVVTLVVAGVDFALAPRDRIPYAAHLQRVTVAVDDDKPDNDDPPACSSNLSGALVVALMALARRQRQKPAISNI